MPSLIEVDGLVVRFGDDVAVDHVDLTVPAGGSVALVGKNGAGKSTTLRVLAGVVPPSNGWARIAGYDVVTHAMAAKERLGYCPDVGGLVPRATPWEHLQLAAMLRGQPRGWEERGRTLLAQFDLTGAADRVVAGFSHGMARRLSVVLAAFHSPQVLLLDEPFDGVDPTGVEATMDVVAHARQQGAAVLVSTHLLDLAARACDQTVVLRDGSVVSASASAELAGEAGLARYRSLLA